MSDSYLAIEDEQPVYGRQIVGMREKRVTMYIFPDSDSNPEHGGQAIAEGEFRTKNAEAYRDAKQRKSKPAERRDGSRDADGQDHS